LDGIIWERKNCKCSGARGTNVIIVQIVPIMFAIEGLGRRGRTRSVVLLLVVLGMGLLVLCCFLVLLGLVPCMTNSLNNKRERRALSPRESLE
jgi:hypothetical protein